VARALRPGEVRGTLQGEAQLPKEKLAEAGGTALEQRSSPHWRESWVGNEAEIDGKQAQAAGHRPPLPDRPVEKLDEAGPQHLDLTVVRQAGRAQESKLSLLARHQERVGDPPWQVRMARNRGKVLQFPGEPGRTSRHCEPGPPSGQMQQRRSVPRTPRGGQRLQALNAPVLVGWAPPVQALGQLTKVAVNGNNADGDDGTDQSPVHVAAVKEGPPPRQTDGAPGRPGRRVRVSPVAPPTQLAATRG
jgi:hypothetical protein